MQLERLTDARFGAGDTAAVRDALVRHLRENKLPLVESFVDANLFDTEGRPVLSVYSDPHPAPSSSERDTTWIGPLTAPGWARA